MNLQRLAGRYEAAITCLRGEQGRDLLIADFERARTTITDKKWHLMRLTGVVATNERVDRFELVNEAMLKQKIQRAIDRRRRRETRTVLETIKQVIGLDRNRRFSNQFEDAQSNRGEAQTALTADL